MFTHTGTNNLCSIEINNKKTLMLSLWPQSTLHIPSVHWTVPCTSVSILYYITDSLVKHVGKYIVLLLLIKPSYFIFVLSRVRNRSEGFSCARQKYFYESSRLRRYIVWIGDKRAEKYSVYYTAYGFSDPGIYSPEPGSASSVRDRTDPSFLKQSIHWKGHYWIVSYTLDTDEKFKICWVRFIIFTMKVS